MHHFDLFFNVCFGPWGFSKAVFALSTRCIIVGWVSSLHQLLLLRPWRVREALVLRLLHEDSASILLISQRELSLLPLSNIILSTEVRTVKGAHLLLRVHILLIVYLVKL